MNTHAATARLNEIDALRGLAALAVVLFHYTFQFERLYPSGQTPLLTFQHGHLGVNLFFIISGFVIFMTLERTKKPLDFLVSRASRLYPAYWVAVPMTYLVVSSFGLEGKATTAWQAFFNLSMVHSFFDVPPVDGVYWTLEIELLFYAMMFALYRLRGLQRVHYVLCGLMALRLLDLAATHQFGRGLPWMVLRYLILTLLPWFALGIAVYQLKSAQYSRGLLATVVMALLTLWAAHDLGTAILALSFAALTWAAATGRAWPLRWPVLTWLGSISYALYLVHENMGWVLMRELMARGWSINSAIACAIVASLALASLITRWVEQPAMHAIRNAYRRHQARHA